MYKLKNAKPDKWSNYNVVMNTDETAALLGLHPNTIKTLANRGEIPARKVGRNWRFDRDTIRAWLNNQLNDNEN